MSRLQPLSPDRSSQTNTQPDNPRGQAKEPVGTEPMFKSSESSNTSGCTERWTIITQEDLLSLQEFARVRLPAENLQLVI
jgi:hypothetical protein